MDEINISLKPETLFNLWGIDITNGMMGSLLVSFLLIIFALVFRTGIKREPSKAVVIVEGMFMYFMELLEKTFGDRKKAMRYFPITMTLFLYILVANFFAMIPLVGSFQYDGITLFREPSADMSFAIGFAFVVILASNVFGFIKSPFNKVFSYIRINKILDVRGPISFGNFLLEMFLGILDIIGEFAKVLSLGCRLFGNIFAGGVVLVVVTTLVNFVAPSPFYALSILSGVIQAFVYVLLSVQFFSMGAEVGE